VTASARYGGSLAWKLTVKPSLERVCAASSRPIFETNSFGYTSIFSRCLTLEKPRAPVGAAFCIKRPRLLTRRAERITGKAGHS